MHRNIVFIVDVEPDGRKLGASDSWDGSAIAFQELSTLRHQIQESTGAAACLNWFPRFDPQIERTWGRRDWVTQACPTFARTALDHGDYTGIHVHMWKWDDARQDWFNDFSDPSWRAECVECSIQGHEAVFGKRPSASRFGDRSLLQDDIAMLWNYGIRYDLTVEPGVPAHKVSIDRFASCDLPDMRRAPLRPYQPSYEDYLSPRNPASSRKAGEELWMLPLTVTDRPYWVPLRLSPFLIHTRLTLNLVLRPRRVWAQLSAEMNRETAEPIVFVVRSGDLAQPALLKNFRYVMQRMVKHPNLCRCRFVAADQAVKEFATHGYGTGV